MPQLIWSVLCSKGCLDSYSNQVSLLDVIEGLNIKTNQPEGRLHIPVQMNLVSFWMRSDPGAPETFEARANLLMPDGTELPGLALSGDLQTNQKLRTFMRIEGLEIREPGPHWLAVEYRTSTESEWVRVAKVPLDVQIERVTGGPQESRVAEPQARPTSPARAQIRQKRSRK